MEQELIYNTILIINNNLNIILPDTDNIKDYKVYLGKVLNDIKKPKHIPHSWIDERDDLLSRLKIAKKELEMNLIQYARADSFGDGMPRGQSNPDSENDKQNRRIELEQDIIPNIENKLNAIDLKIKSLDMDFDNNIKDQIKDLIEVVPNEKHKDILKQFYIYRKTYRQIANDSFYSEATAKDYRQKGFITLANILLNFSINSHLK